MNLEPARVSGRRKAEVVEDAGSLRNSVGPRSSARLAVTADDYGLHRDINRGIRHCVEQGWVNSVSVGLCGEAADREELRSLVRLQNRFAHLDVGVHLMLTESSPLTGCACCRGDDGRFLLHSRQLASRAFGGRLKGDEITVEWRAQIDRALDAGLRLSHLDSHQHVHLLPGLWAVYRALARCYDIPRIRCGYDSLPRAVLQAKPAYAAMQLLAFPRYLMVTPRVRTLGVLESCAFRCDRIEARLERALRRGESVEIMVHPGVETAELLSRFGYWNACWGREIHELAVLRHWLDRRGYPPFEACPAIVCSA